MFIQSFVPLLLLILISTAHAEIQVLFRGNCYTESEAADKLAQFAASYQTAEEWKARVEQNRTGILRGMQLHRLPPAAPLHPIRHSVRHEDGYTVENCAFESLPGFWVTGNLYLPARFEPPLPGVLCPHGHSSDGRLNEHTQKRCAALARMGTVVFAYDMIGYGESSQVPHKHSEALRLQTYNSMRAIDFLESLDVVDKKRIAITGESGGGTQSFILACVDPRVAVCVPVVMVSAYFFGGCICESGMPIHKSDNHETNNVEIAACMAPKPLLVISCGGDWTKNVPSLEFPYLQRVYSLFGAVQMVENAHFPDEGHDYGPSKRAAMYRFLAKHLGLDLTRITTESGDIDESFVSVQTRDNLLVFPPTHPRPEHALTNADEVFSKLNR